MAAAHFGWRMTEDLVGTMMTGTLIDRAMIEMTSDRVAVVEVALAKLTSAVASLVTIRVAHHPRNVIMTVAATELAPVLEELAEHVIALHLYVAAIGRAQEAQMVLIGTCLGQVALDLRL